MPRFGCLFSADELEILPSYKSNGWNEWPAVTPPKVGHYRVEVFENAYDSEPEIRVAGYWNGKRWLIPQEGGRTRFRAWEDEE